MAQIVEIFPRGRQLMAHLFHKVNISAAGDKPPLLLFTT